MSVPVDRRHADQQALTAAAPSGRPNHLHGQHRLTGAVSSGVSHPLSIPGRLVPGAHTALSRAGGEPIPVPANHRHAIVHPATAHELMHRYRRSSGMEGG
jgi:hypothetical protein